MFIVTTCIKLIDTIVEGKHLAVLHSIYIYSYVFSQINIHVALTNSKHIKLFEPIILIIE